MIKEISTTKNTYPASSHSDSTEKSKGLQTAKAKRIQHHHISFTTRAKGTSPGRKHKRREQKRKRKKKKETYKNKPRKGEQKKMVEK